MANNRAPKQWSLTRNETITSFESWRQNLLYTLSLDASFATFLLPNTTWLKKTRAAPLRGFHDDAEDVPNRRTAAQKVAQLDLLLGQIANFCPIISRNTIVKNSTSVESIWQSIRAHYGFQSTGAHFIDLINIQLKPDERPEDLFQRLMAFVEDSLLNENSGLTHHGEAIGEEEELTPTLENFIVLQWLHLLHKDLPALVKQRYGTELRSRTLASIKPEISQAMDSLLESIQSNDEAKVLRSASSFHRSKQPSSSTRRPSSIKASCPLCSSMNRPSNHFLSKCQFLPDQDRRFMAKARLIAALDENDQPEVDLQSAEDLPSHIAAISLPSSTRRVQVKSSPVVNMKYKQYDISTTLDTGSETNMISESTARLIHAPITPSSQSAVQADGQSELSVIGETRINLTFHNKTFSLEALVVKNLDGDVIAGIPFLSEHDITLRPSKRQVNFNDGSAYVYNNLRTSKPANIKRTSSYILRAPATTVWPNEYLEMTVPPEWDDQDIVLEPRSGDGINRHLSWPPPMITRPKAGKIRIPNSTDQPKVLRKNQQFAQIIPAADPSLTVPSSLPAQSFETITPTPPLHTIVLDESNQLPPDIRSAFKDLHQEFSSVFDPSFPGYNGASGPIKAIVNMGPVEPPQRKGKVPQYSNDKLHELQAKCDELERLQVLRKPEDLGITPEYLNPSFLVKKPSGGFRLVTSFGEVAQYSKPQPALMPDVNATLQSIGQWKYIIQTDLTQAFYQIPLAKSSVKYCGISTPFRGTRVYARSAMGMPGSETALEELMSRVLGELIENGYVAKVADDLYCGGNTPRELLSNWRKVLTALDTNKLTLSARKTVIAPKSATILGWIWSEGTLKASPHRISTLSTCARPDKVKGLRSYLGAYKFLSRVIPNCSTYLAPLESLVAGKVSTDVLNWTDELLQVFRDSQSHLHNNRSITIPQPDDQLWIVTDGAEKLPGIGSTLYVQRNGSLKIAGYFSAKLKERQISWIPCEIEALSIAVSLLHFSPYIIQSKHQVSVLTDSQPCVQAHQRLLRGNFSHSNRLTTFLSAASRFNAQLQHLAGSTNVPSDFQSRNAAECLDTSCQICSFVNDLQSASVLKINIDDITAGTTKMPFINRPAWISLQADCQDLRRCHAYLKQGTRPSKKLTNIKDTKRYIQNCTISRDGLLVVPHQEAFAPVKERIVVPRKVLPGLLTALHIKLVHPTQFQLKKIFSRYFFALDIDSALRATCENCHTCFSLKKIDHSSLEAPSTTSDPPPAIGLSFAGDVLRREKQFILVLRESVTSYTLACIIDSEDHINLRNGLIQLCVGLIPLDGPSATIRTDPAPGFQKLVQDTVLAQHRIIIELGRAKNINKNPVAEKSIQELEDEILKLDRDRSTVTNSQLAIAVANLNSRLRSQGLSSREMWTQRDQFTSTPLPLNDQKLIEEQHHRRLTYNMRHNQIGCKPSHDNLPIPEGSIVYINTERNKTQSRPRYIVSSQDGPWYQVKKFIGTQLRNLSYRVHRNQLSYIPVPDPPSSGQPTSHNDEEETTYETESPPDTNTAISTPLQPRPTVQPPSVPIPPAALTEPPPSVTVTPNVQSQTPDVEISRPERQRRLPVRFSDYDMS